MQWATAVLAVDLGRRGVKKLAAQLGCAGDYDVVAADVAQQALDRAVDNQLDADGSGEVDADVGGLKAVAHERLVRDRAFDELDQIRLERVVQILKPAGAQIVEDQYFVAAFRQHIDQVRADEAGSTRNQVFQCRLLDVEPGGRGFRLAASPLSCGLACSSSNVRQVSRFRKTG